MSDIYILGASFYKTSKNTGHDKLRQKEVPLPRHPKALAIDKTGKWSPKDPRPRPELLLDGWSLAGDQITTKPMVIHV